MRSCEYIHKDIHYGTICDTENGKTAAYQLCFIHAMGYYTSHKYNFG